MPGFGHVCADGKKISGHFNARFTFKGYVITLNQGETVNINNVGFNFVMSAGGFDPLKNITGDNGVLEFLHNSGGGDGDRAAVNYLRAAACNGCAVERNFNAFTDADIIGCCRDADKTQLRFFGFARSGEGNIVDFDAVAAAVGQFVLNVAPFKVIQPRFGCGEGIAAESGHIRVGIFLVFNVVNFKVIVVVIGFAAVEIVKRKRVAFRHADGCEQHGGGIAHAGVVGLCNQSVSLGNGNEAVFRARAEFKTAAFNVDGFGKGFIGSYGNGNRFGPDNAAVHADGAGDFGFAAAHTGDDGSASAACIRFNDRNGLVRTRPCCDKVICIFGNKGHIDVHGLRHFNIRACDVKAESGKINKGEAAPEFPCAVYGLRTVGICGESVNITHNNRVCIAVRVAYAVFFNHLGKGFRNGGGVFKILHKVPESLFVYIIACESDALRIAVNNTCTRAKQCCTGGALAAALHTFANCHPNETV